MSNLINTKKFSDGVTFVFNKANDDKLWELYLRSMDERSFIDWKKEVAGQRGEIQQEHDFEATKKKSHEILRKFKTS